MENIEMYIKAYEIKIFEELKRRGISEDDIPKVIAKTGFMDALHDYPEEQLHYPVSCAVDEILITAALH